jgi:hypothetical protein
LLLCFCKLKKISLTERPSLDQASLKRSDTPQLHFLITGLFLHYPTSAEVPLGAPQQTRFCLRLRFFAEGGKKQVSSFANTSKQGCQIFIGPKYQNGEKYTKLPQNIPNGHKIFPMAIK